MDDSKEVRRRELYNLLGDLPERDFPISAQKLRESDNATYLLEELVLQLNGIEPVPAYFLRSKIAEPKAPAIIYNHAHCQGREEVLCGNEFFVKPGYGPVLAGLGYHVLCIDAWNFGERSGRTETELFKQMLWNGQVLWGMMVYDSLKAIDYLMSREDVDSRRIGSIGLSMGSNMTQWLAALDTRVKVSVDLCCLTDFGSLMDTGNLDGHGTYYYVPSLLKHFTASQINCLIAPRRHLSLAGIYDRLTPLAGLDKIDKELKRTYRDENAADAWTLMKFPVGHRETAAMRYEALAYFQRHL